MIKKNRQEKLLAYLREHKVAQVNVLSEMLDVSAVTIRHDLDQLQEQGKVVRSHGGAMLADTPLSNASIYASMRRGEYIPNLALKERIAKEAIRLIEPNDSVFIGGGTTFYVMARHLKQFPDLRIVTNNISLAFELAQFNPNIYIIGGELVNINGVYYTGGPKIPLELEKIYVNKAFIGISGIDLKAGLTIYDLSQLNLHMSIPKVARSVILVCDSTKFGYQSAHRIGPVEDVVGTIITNDSVDHYYRQEMKKRNIRMILA